MPSRQRLGRHLDVDREGGEALDRAHNFPQVVAAATVAADLAGRVGSGQRFPPASESFDMTGIGLLLVRHRDTRARRPARASAIQAQNSIWSGQSADHRPTAHVRASGLAVLCGAARADHRPSATPHGQRAREGTRPKRLLESGECGSITDFAAAEKINRSYLCRVLRLTLLAPELVEGIMDGAQPEEVTLPALMKGFPMEWERQRGWLPGDQSAPECRLTHTSCRSPNDLVEPSPDLRVIWAGRAIASMLEDLPK